ncbi:MAG: DNA replication/repair protein RecF [Ignavibacteriales bacterium]|nr:DNA replication/repair protein RecF [Ignavibacteriales bacterium]
MRLKSLRLRNFRNHTETAIQCCDKTNVFLGENGEGKTNILEAISYLCLTKSFFGSSDSTALQLGKSGFELNGEIHSDGEITYHTKVSYDGDPREKMFSINKSPVEKFSSVIGQFPIVILSPEGSSVTFGMPADRRKFMDFVISQSSKLYLEDLLEYRRILKQRNKILLDAKLQRTDCSELLEPWDNGLVERGALLMQRRWNFVQEFYPHIVIAHRLLSEEAETPSLQYHPSVAVDSFEEQGVIRDQLFDALRQARNEERRTGSTTVGPHKDELDFTINNLELRKFASQGQHKTFLVALKTAEFFYLRERCNETPLLLLDDVFSELDSHRSKQLLELIHSLGQTFITATNESLFPANFDWTESNRKFFVHQGAVVYDEAGNLIN